MKKLLFSAILMATLMVSCNQKNEKSDTPTQDQTEQSAEKYCCPMHPEVQGAKGDKCPKCGMELTEPVSKTEKDHESHPMKEDTISK